ncbi:response regulator transcription factor [Colwellia sp. 20A7]|uniref:response regulator transcription factor n=1 Tax=Colwellia sp. 20A7 TaxID=2689569 RepID=UPI001357EB9B|nr:response regulator transcription factor [Colwellia sp. 20A7]
MKILIVEDDIAIMETIVDYLDLHGHIVDFAYNGVAAISQIKTQSFDVIIMDIMMPKLNGIATVERLRNEYLINTPILFLTARDSLEDKRKAFNVGGDDYLVKPFALEELLLRIDSLGERGQSGNKQALTVGDLYYNLQTNSLYRNNEPIKLSKIQHQMMRLLMQKFPTVVSRQQMIEQIWGDEEPPSDALRSHIYALRKVLNKGINTNSVETLHGQGFKLVN